MFSRNIKCRRACDTAEQLHRRVLHTQQQVHGSEGSSSSSGSHQRRFDYILVLPRLTLDHVFLDAATVAGMSGYTRQKRLPLEIVEAAAGDIEAAKDKPNNSTLTAPPQVAKVG